MAERYPGRYPGEPHSYEPDRDLDEQLRERERERARLQNRSAGERGWSGERWEEPRRWSGDVHPQYDRTGAAYRGWNEPNLGYRPAPGFGYGPPAGESGYDRGTHAGRGPKGYQRSDSRIHEDVCDRLTDDPYLDAGEVEVNVASGEVVLSGWVRTRDDKRRAEDLAEHVSGVRDVRNHLRIGKGSTELMNNTPS